MAVTTSAAAMPAAQARADAAASTASTLLARLRAGEVLAGMQCFTASPVLVEAMGHAGLDFVTVDMEHCPTGLETLAHLLRAADASGIAPLARVPRLDGAEIGRVLDLGAAGIVLPHASTERCRQALRHARYAPVGDRSACPMIRAAGYLTTDWTDFARRRDDALVVPLIEDVEGLASCEEILDLDGIEVVFLGPFDLSLSMGLAGQDYRHPRLAQALDRVTRAARARGKFVMTTVASRIDHGYASLLLQNGVRLLSFSADVGVFAAACRGIAGLARSAVTEAAA